ncbi:hypothetical protein [Corynebacterium ulceribovis]|uniref:hypothetical protein n=1 Tax=Corynebacterium ulceribovis TaxID=487732 RepID=UPI00036730F1|nr:hypothetical protein [Corynebacterium ulceribovis]
MSAPQFGALVGILLAIAAIVGGLGGFLLAVAFALVGGILAAQFTGRVDVSTLSLRSAAQWFDSFRPSAGTAPRKER